MDTHFNWGHRSKITQFCCCSIFPSASSSWFSGLFYSLQSSVFCLKFSVFFVSLQSSAFGLQHSVFSLQSSVFFLLLSFSIFFCLCLSSSVVFCTFLSSVFCVLPCVFCLLLSTSPSVLFFNLQSSSSIFNILSFGIPPLRTKPAGTVFQYFPYSFISHDQSKYV